MCVGGGRGGGGGRTFHPGNCVGWGSEGVNTVFVDGGPLCPMTTDQATHRANGKPSPVHYEYSGPLSVRGFLTSWIFSVDGEPNGRPVTGPIGRSMRIADWTRFLYEAAPDGAHSDHRFPAPSSKLYQIWLCH